MACDSDATSESPRDEWARIQRSRLAARASVAPLPILEPGQIQPDNDCPGLYLQCHNKAQREIIMRALGWKGAEAMAEIPNTDPRLRSAAVRGGAFALYPIMEREGMDDLALASAGELAETAIAEYERIIAGGEILW